MASWLETKGYGEWTPEQAARYPWYVPEAAMTENLENKRRWDREHGTEDKRPIFNPYTR